MENNLYEKESDVTNSIQPKKGWTRKKVVILVLVCCLLLGGLIEAGWNIFSMRDRSSETTQDLPKSTMMEGVREKSVLDIITIDTSKEMTPAEVYAANVNSTVGITTSVTTNFWGFHTTSAAAGSGFILTDDGYIITNHHVIENSDSVTVSFYDGSAYEAEVIGYDESNDIAVLKVEVRGLTPVVIGDSGNLNVGDSVIAIGNPLGELTFSLTSGAVSALDREITLSNSITMDLIQTDCAINSGNSGGALFNLYGEVIGVTNAKYSGAGGGASIDNIGFAIPINHVKDIIKSIIENGYIAKPYIGVSVIDVSKETQSYGLPKGAAVRSIAEDSPAEAAGLEESDIITAINGEEINGSKGLVDAVRDASVGAELVFTVYRKGESIELKVIIGEEVQPARADKKSEEEDQENRQMTFPWSSRPR